MGEGLGSGWGGPSCMQSTRSGTWGPQSLRLPAGPPRALIMPVSPRRPGIGCWTARRGTAQ
eukprot:3514314-Lingulodinium_polyedra.AAC.1